MAIICGVEEAGRGPVIGPMVMAGVTIDERDVDELQKIGVKDSKMLSPKKREELFDQIKSIVKADEIVVIYPAKIDEALRSENLNLNWLEAETSADIINKLQPSLAILDCPSNNIEAYKSYVKERVDKAEIIAEHKADEKYVVVGAASILAKVTRDREVAKIREQIGIDFGSGYPSDPKTIAFLKENWDKHDSIFRKTWSSYQKVVSNSKQKGLGEY